MTFDDILVFDTKTTGLPDRKLQWFTDYMEFPHVVQLAWINQFKAESHIIRPDGWEIPQEATDVHGITMERALKEGEPFAYVIDKFIEDCLESPLVCDHNIYFDTSIIKANILRELGQEYYNANRVEDALYKGKRIDTCRSTMKWVDARMANGRMKLPKLEELYSRCFPGESYPAHDAFEDVKALRRCLPVLIKNGLVELKIKEYPDEEKEQAKAITEHLTYCAKIAADNAKKLADAQPEIHYPAGGIAPQSHETPERVLTPGATEKCPQIENSPKISEIETQLLNETEF